MEMQNKDTDLNEHIIFLKIGASSIVCIKNCDYEFKSSEKKIYLFFFFHTPIACTAERFFRIDRAQEHLHYVADICNDELYVLDPADDHNSTTSAPTSSITSCSNYNMNYTMVTSSTGSALNQQANLQTSTASIGESNTIGNTIVLFKPPDDQQISTTNSSLTSNYPISTIQQETIDRSITIDRTTLTTSQSQMQPKLSSTTNISSNIVSNTISSIETSTNYQQSPTSSFDSKREIDLDSNANRIAQQRQHHGNIIANRSIELLSSDNEHVLFKAASSGDTASISSLCREGYSLLTLDSQGK